MTHHHLRPIERVIVRFNAEGTSIPEIGRRVGKKPGTVARILEMVDYRQAPPRQDEQTLRPIERVVLRLRDRGESYGEIGNRIGRSGRHVRNIEQYADFKLEG